jgi:hypothetical protein
VARLAVRHLNAAAGRAPRLPECPLPACPLAPRGSRSLRSRC